MSDSKVIEIKGACLKSTGTINLYIEPGDRVLISGGSGSGKTTLLKIMNGLVENGRIRWRNISYKLRL